MVGTLVGRIGVELGGVEIEKPLSQPRASFLGFRLRNGCRQCPRRPFGRPDTVQERVFDTCDNYRCAATLPASNRNIRQYKFCYALETGLAKRVANTDFVDQTAEQLQIDPRRFSEPRPLI